MSAGISWLRSHFVLLGLFFTGLALIPSTWGWVPALGMATGTRSELGAGLVAGAVIGWAIGEMERERSTRISAALERLCDDDLLTLATEIAMAYAGGVDQVRTELVAGSDGEGDAAATFKDTAGRQWTNGDLIMLRRALFKVVLAPRKSPAALSQDATGHWLVLIEAMEDVLYAASVVHHYRFEASPQRTATVASAFETALTELNRAVDATAGHGAPRRVQRLLDTRRNLANRWRDLQRFAPLSDEHLWGRDVTADVFTHVTHPNSPSSSPDEIRKRTDPGGLGRPDWHRNIDEIRALLASVVNE